MLPDRGFLLIDKPAGISSFDVIRRLRKIIGIRRIGHCGTLDPFATGLLICALGSYTRLNSYLEARDKSYQATLRLGISTSTGDPEGEITETLPLKTGYFDPETLRSDILAISELAIPVYSAVKIDGQRAYAMARAGKAVDLAPRPTRIYDFAITSLPDPASLEPQLSYWCRVSKGTYIRSLSQWIATWLGSVGYTTALRRTAIGDIDLAKAVPLEELNPDNWTTHLAEPRSLFGHLPLWIAAPHELRSLSAGQDLLSEGADTDCLIVCDGSGSIVGVATRHSGTVHPKVNLR